MTNGDRITGHRQGPRARQARLSHRRGRNDFDRLEPGCHAHHHGEPRCGAVIGRALLRNDQLSLSWSAGRANRVRTNAADRHERGDPHHAHRRQSSGRERVGRSTSAPTLTRPMARGAIRSIWTAANRTRSYETIVDFDSWLQRRDDDDTLTRNDLQLDVRRLLSRRWLRSRSSAFRRTTNWISIGACSPAAVSDAR